MRLPPGSSGEVHGGEKFADSVIINDEVMTTWSDCADLAPLHNPANYWYHGLLQDYFRMCPQVAVFDTAFHQTMPPQLIFMGYLMSIMSSMVSAVSGFRGTSHKYVSQRAAGNR